MSSPAASSDSHRDLAPSASTGDGGVTQRGSLWQQLRATYAEVTGLWRIVEGPRAVEAKAIRLAQIQRMSSRTPTIVIASLLNTAIVAVVCGPEQPFLAVAIWTGVLWALSLSRLIRWWRARNRVYSGEVSPKTVSYATLSTFAAGCLWGAAAFVVITTGSPASQVIMVLTIAGMSAGASAVFAVLPESVAAFVLPAVGGIVAGWALQGGPISVGLVIMCSVFSVFMVSNSVSAYFAMLEGVRIRLRHESDAEKLAAAYAKVEAVNEQINEELAGARDMQQSLLPERSSIELIEKHWGVRLGHYFKPSAYIGGDLWYLLPQSKDRIGICVFDFTGHGVRAAINTFRLHASLQTLNKKLTSPTELMEELNKQLYRILPRGQMATAIIGIVDKTNDTFTYAAAGAPAPLIYNPSDDTFTVADGSGLPLAAMGLTDYDERVVPFPPGASLVVYSDALTEFRDLEGNMPGEDWLFERAEHHLRHGLPEDFLTVLLADFDEARDGPIGDDLTLVHLWRPE
jgi:serine phosphatase RsbU (regulator of sigma subunit)